MVFFRSVVNGLLKGFDVVNFNNEVVIFLVCFCLLVVLFGSGDGGLKIIFVFIFLLV